MARPVRIANFSAYLGDRYEALAQAITGEPAADVVIGDFMAEITMSMVAAGFAAHPSALQQFYAPSLLPQLRPVLGEIAARGTKVVANAGIFDPAGLAAAIQTALAEDGIALRVAHVRGDDLLPELAELVADGELAHLDTGKPLTDHPTGFVAANAYLGGWGIAEALRGGADIVITGRVADASLVTGPAAWWHGWMPNDLDRIAGAVAAAHIIECGPQATGGNFSGFATVADNTVTGFPLAEVADDGSSVITKRAGEGGQVTIDTVTAQLLYEVQGPRYLNPDVVLHVDALRLRQLGPDRVEVSGAVGSPAPTTAKVALHRYDGFRAVFWVYPTGTDTMDDLLELLHRQADEAARDLDLDTRDFCVLGQPKPDPRTQYEATVAVRVAVAGPTEAAVLQFLHRFGGMGLGGIPGFYIDFIASGVGGQRAQPRVAFWPGLVDQRRIRHEVVFDDGTVHAIRPPSTAPFAGQPVTGFPAPSGDLGPAVAAPLGRLVYTRAGDKGGSADLGVWLPQTVTDRPRAYAWLSDFLTPERLAKLLGTGPDVAITRFAVPHLFGISFVLENYFGESGSASIGLDQIGKAIGEFLRTRRVPIPAVLLAGE